MGGIVIMVDKTSERCSECRTILKYGHSQYKQCSQWSPEDEARGRRQMEIDRAELEAGN